MKTNYQMLKDLDDFNPKTRGVLTGEEAWHIAETLHLAEMDELALRNLRDTAVMFYSLKVDRLERDGKDNAAYDLMDIMSGITGVIDNALWKIGAEV